MDCRYGGDAILLQGVVIVQSLARIEETLTFGGMLSRLVMLCLTVLMV